MKNKISIYKLLGLVKDGKAPKKIKCDGVIYRYEFQNTITGAFEYRSENYNCLMNNMAGHLYLTDILNNEVEIIEDKEYEDIEELNLMFPICNDIKNAELGGFASIYKSNLVNIKYKIDELIKEVNKLKNK